MATLPAERSLTVYKGDTSQFTLSFTDDADDPIDVSERTFRAQIRATRESTGDPLASWTVTRPADHQVTFTLAAASTAALSVVDAVWDVEMTNGTVVTTLLTGAVRVKPDVSRT